MSEEQKTRAQQIHDKGFDMNLRRYEDYLFEDSPISPQEYSKIKVGVKSLTDAIYNLGEFKRLNSRYADKHEVLRAIDNNDLESLRFISDFFYKTSGIYARLCKYMANLYRYDWLVTPYIYSNSVNNDKVVSTFNKILFRLDKFGVKKFLGDTALKVIRYGCYYGYIVENTDNVSVQELPIKYCRSRFSVNNKPTVEFNMKFFDNEFRDEEYRKRILNLFPKEFKKGYELYKRGALPPDESGDESGWYLLDPDYSIKFNLNGEDYPAFVSVIPAIIDLDEAQALDKKKMQQQLLKIIIQKLPLDKNGDLIFDIDEARALHNNAVEMLQRAIGVDVLTTFADVDVEDMADTTTNTTTDELQKVERTVFNEAGVSQMQFNTDGNIALEKSILNDEASMYNLLAQFEIFLNDLLKSFNTSPKKIFYKVQLLTTTIYNYKDLSKLYKEQTQMGYSKILPQLALGQSQSSIIANAKFENEILELYNIFIPPMTSNTMNADTITGLKSKSSETTSKTTTTTKTETSSSDSKVGRPEKGEDELTEKTIQNKESMS